MHTLLLNLVGFFFGMSKAFDKVWYEGLIFKLKSVGISDVLLKFIKSFFWQTGFRELYQMVRHQSVYW